LNFLIAIGLPFVPFLARNQSHSLGLEQALNLAWANRASVQAARLEVDQARLSQKAISAFSTTSLQIGYSSDVNVGGTDADLVISQPIDIAGRRSAFRQSGRSILALAETNLRRTMSDLQSEVIERYIEAANAAQMARIATDGEDAATRLLAAVKGLVEGGKLPGVQATRVSIELDRAKGLRKQRLAEYEAALRRLKAAIGNDEPISVESLPALGTNSVSDRDLVGQRADLQLLAAEAMEAEADAKVARLARLPQLEVQGRRSPWQTSSPTYGARIQFSFPLNDAGRSRAEEQAALKRAEAKRKSLSDASRIARSELDAEKIEIEGAQGQIAELQSALASGTDLVTRTQTGLTEGANTLIDVLDALRAVREVKESLIGARLALATAQAHYLRATGTLLEARK